MADEDGYSIRLIIKNDSLLIPFWQNMMYVYMQSLKKMTTKGTKTK